MAFGPENVEVKLTKSETDPSQNSNQLGSPVTVSACN
jgi:hypothetical protein